MWKSERWREGGRWGREGEREGGRKGGREKGGRELIIPSLLQGLL